MEVNNTRLDRLEEKELRRLWRGKNSTGGRCAYSNTWVSFTYTTIQILRQHRYQDSQSVCNQSYKPGISKGGLPLCCYSNMEMWHTQTQAPAPKQVWIPGKKGFASRLSTDRPCRGIGEPGTELGFTPVGPSEHRQIGWARDRARDHSRETHWAASSQQEHACYSLSLGVFPKCMSKLNPLCKRIKMWALLR